MSDNGQERIPPMNIAAEENVLACVLTEPDSLYEVLDRLKPEQFFRPDNTEIWRAVLELSEKNEPIDHFTVKDWLNRRKVVDDGYLEVILTVTADPDKIDTYAKRIIEADTRRKLITAVRVIGLLAFDLETDIEKVIGDSDAAFQAALAGAELEKGLRPALDITRDLMIEVDNVIEHGEGAGIPTGFSDLDLVLDANGLERGSLVVLGGDSGMGKSALAGNFLVNTAKAGYISACFSMEMPAVQVIRRQVGAFARLGSGKIKRAYDMTENDYAEYMRAAGEVSELSLYIDDSAGMSPTKLRSRLRRLKGRVGLDLVVVDYLALMKATRRFPTETLRLDYLSRSLKETARELDIVLIALVQINTKQVAIRTDKRPTLADVRNSSDPNNHSDVVMLLYRDDYYDEASSRANIAELNIAKQRDGRTAIIDLYWHAEYVSFKNLSRNERVIDHFVAKADPDPQRLMF